MTTPRTAQVLALIAAAQARVAGMTAANQQRLVCGESIMYSEDHFANEAGHLEKLAYEVIQQ